MKKIIQIFTFLIICSAFINLKVKASTNDFVYLSGDSIGIKMDTGVYVAGKYQVQTNNGKISPWKDSNIEVGDKIVKIDNITVESNNDILNYLSKCKNESVNLTICRNKSIYNTEINVLKNLSNEYTIGLYIRDKILGIGTMTFITNDKYFASLGHGIYDNNVLLNTLSGSIYYSSVSSIKKAEPGVAGEKRASIDNISIGKILSNDVTGLYGKINSINNKNKIGIGCQNDVKIGPAKIYTSIEKNDIREYDIEICECVIQKKSSIKGLKIKIVDEDLINQTGGIVQGMSGSPIVQNGKIIGAVSHVTLENPIYGYGMHVEWMLEEVKKIA